VGGENLVFPWAEALLGGELKENYRYLSGSNAWSRAPSLLTVSNGSAGCPRASFHCRGGETSFLGGEGVSRFVRSGDLSTAASGRGKIVKGGSGGGKSPHPGELQGVCRRLASPSEGRGRKAFLWDEDWIVPSEKTRS